MREVDLTGFGQSQFFTTYRLKRFQNWVGVKNDWVFAWLAGQSSNHTGFKFGGNLYFECCGEPPADIRRPKHWVRRWHMLWYDRCVGSAPKRTKYVGNLHVDWNMTGRPNLENIEFCFHRQSKAQIHEALKQGFVEVRLKHGRSS
ncbi:MAG: hypothetical protein ABJL67_09230 [Sulfitobacter sp.]